jgi:hypothetical protein
VLLSNRDERLIVIQKHVASGVRQAIGGREADPGAGRGRRACEKPGPGQALWSFALVEKFSHLVTRGGSEFAAESL